MALCFASLCFGSEKVQTADRFAPIVAELERAIANQEVPGAVVAVMHHGEVVFRGAFGKRSLEPYVEPMTVDTIFDMASMTKPIATATAILKLMEQGKLKLDDEVAHHWPEFAVLGKKGITIEQLLLHTSGLPSGNHLTDFDDGPAKAMERISQLKLVARPGEKFIYSDVGYIILGELVQRISGQRLDQFVVEQIVTPLGLKDTCYRPGEEQKKRCAPAEPRDGKMIRGEVHDPRAFVMGGAAGHAGLFSTADDLIIFSRMLLNGGNHKGESILRPETIALMTKPRPAPPDGRRGLGWDINTSYSANRGDIAGGYGHTGFTGTSIWIEPEKDLVVIFLSNRLHPKPRGSINALRGKIASLASQAISQGDVKPKPDQVAGTLTGLDVLVRDGFQILKGRKIGLVTNPTGRDRRGHSTIDLLYQAPEGKLVALFGPEHGIRGGFDENVKDSNDAKTGLPVYSLYGPRRKPTGELFHGIDSIVFDMQDVGCRFYTYISTLGLVMEACAEHDVKLIVLDRPNPINGVTIEGPLPDADRSSFVCYHNIPLRHGMTVGELALMYRTERKLNVGLEVVKCENWKRSDFWDRTNLDWVNPSPNMRSLTQALLYPGIGLLETTNVSVGRGTDSPFEWVGAPWIDGRRLKAALDQFHLPGVRLIPTSKTPNSSWHTGKPCGGVQIVITDWKRVEPVRVGITFAQVLRASYPKEWDCKRFDTLLMHREAFDDLVAGKPVARRSEQWSIQAAGFHERRKPFLLYD